MLCTQFLHLKNGSGRHGVRAQVLGKEPWGDCFPDKLGFLPPSLSLLTELEASADEPGAVGPVGNCSVWSAALRAPLLVKTAEMRDSVGALGPRGRPLSLAGVQGCGGDKEEPMSSLSEAPLQGQGRVRGSARPSSFCPPFTFHPVY